MRGEELGVRKRKHHDLRVWQGAMNLVEEIYKITSLFPKDELYALTNQMRRAAVSVPSNIAEGAARNSSKEFLYFLSIARGSLSELETQLQIAERLGYMKKDCFPDNIETIFGLLGGLMKSIRKGQ